jgi:polysaccharide transporter, PST family
VILLNKKMLENIISLFILQGGNYILPLIIFPYLVRVLGVEGYGVIVTAAAFINYFVVFTDYGFNLTATREIAMNRNNSDRINEVFSEVMFTKFSMVLISLLLLFVSIPLLENVRSEWEIYLATFLVVLGSVFFPIWYFQGIEQMKYITFLNLFGRFVSVIFIFIFVKEPSDYFIAALIQSLGSLIPGIISYYIIFKKFKIQFVKVKLNKIYMQLKEGLSVFISGVSILSYTSYNTIIIGLMYGPKEAGLFSVALKLIAAIVSLTQPVLQTFAPHLSIKYKNSRDIGRRETIKLGKYLIMFNILVTIGIIFFIEPLILLIFGDISAEIIMYAKILSILPLVTVIAYLTVNILMLNEGLIKYSMYIYLISGILNLIGAPLVLKYSNVTGLVILYLLIEIFIAIMAMIFYVSRRESNEIKYNHT